MPCYEVRTVSVEFKVENIDLLKKAIENAGWRIDQMYKDVSINITDKETSWRHVTISLQGGQMSSTSMEGKNLSSFCNQLKRSYSEVVIDEVAKKQHWIKKKLGENRYQLQRF